jgi:hypothetical protein
LRLANFTIAIVPESVLGTVMDVLLRSQKPVVSERPERLAKADLKAG